MDFERVAGCVPGAQVLAKLSDDKYQVGMKVKLGPVTRQPSRCCSPNRWAGPRAPSAAASPIRCWPCSPRTCKPWSELRQSVSQSVRTGCPS
ncbi:MAG: hypothetical protein M3017_08130 [Actinomycetota bacterium]|nr:hypothetical protein [Actinomycetota bacterium]